MKSTRRSFLALLGLAPIAQAIARVLPAEAVAPPPAFKPEVVAAAQAQLNRRRSEMIRLASFRSELVREHARDNIFAPYRGPGWTDDERAILRLRSLRKPE